MRTVLMAIALCSGGLAAPTLARPNPHAGEIVATEAPAAGHIKVIKRVYSGGTEGYPYQEAEIAARRSSRDAELAQTELRFQLASMALEAGWRYIEVSDLYVYDDTQVDTGNRISNALAGLISRGRRADKNIIGSVFFTDAPNPKTVDALDSYNRLGRQLFGDGFRERTAPAPTKKTQPGRDKSGW